MRKYSLFTVSSAFLISAAWGAPQLGDILIEGINAVAGNPVPTFEFESVALPDVAPVEIPKDRPTTPPPLPPLPLATRIPSDDDYELIAYCINNPHQETCLAFLRMAHYFLSGRLATDPVLKAYLDSLNDGPITAVLTATSVYSTFHTLIGTQTYSRDDFANQKSTMTFYHGTAATGSGNAIPTSDLGFGGIPPIDINTNPNPNGVGNGLPPLPTGLMPITETIFQTLVATLTETIVETYTPPPEISYITIEPPQVMTAEALLAPRPPPEIIYVTETVTQGPPQNSIYASKPPTYECSDLINQPSVQQCMANNGYFPYNLSPNDCSHVRDIVNQNIGAFETCNLSPYKNTTCDGPTTVTAPASVTTIQVAEATKYVGECGKCSDSNSNERNVNVFNTYYSGGALGYYVQGGQPGAYPYGGGYINYKGIRAWSTAYGIYFNNGTRISFHADCSHGNSSQATLPGSNTKEAVTDITKPTSVNINGATSTDYYEAPCTDDIPFVDPEQCSVTAVTHPEDCSETDMHEHTEDCEQ